jgi:hypothetical protein
VFFTGERGRSVVGPLEVLESRLAGATAVKSKPREAVSPDDCGAGLGVLEAPVLHEEDFG